MGGSLSSGGSDYSSQGATITSQLAAGLFKGGRIFLGKRGSFLSWRRNLSKNPSLATSNNGPTHLQRLYFEWIFYI